MQSPPIAQRQPQQQQLLQRPNYLMDIGTLKGQQKLVSAWQQRQDLVTAQARMQSGEL